MFVSLYLCRGECTWLSVHKFKRVFLAGTQLKVQGLKEEALHRYEEAVKICPTYADGFYDLGVYHSEAQQVI